MNNKEKKMIIPYWKIATIDADLFDFEDFTSKNQIGKISKTYLRSVARLYVKTIKKTTNAIFSPMMNFYIPPPPIKDELKKEVINKCDFYEVYV